MCFILFYSLNCKNLNKDMNFFCNFLCNYKNIFYFCIVKQKQWAMV